MRLVSDCRFDKLKCRRIPVPADQGPQVTTKGPVGVATSMSPIPAVVLIAACLLNVRDENP
ncbi:hypothetical protein KUTeg_003642 [Tegillarca granosa]|uniref:Uncharacterized protein n=1 Tax=Tegillarca granosa TaxID=220873 RepID=A0ABQ9FQX0_TEGGR|nr:hypothetical protein KUTeg_003642 [Tegillarca granosa]